MNIKIKDFKVETNERIQLIDITNEVENFVKESKVNNGLCLIYSLHSTTAIIVNEKESGLIQDILHEIQKVFPKDEKWLHNRIDDNADSHLASTFIGTSKVFPVSEGKLIRGAWQNIFLLELDGPRRRKIIIEVLGE
ncbi:MAG: secondary thiamine-phosphate synthase enzyme YjbQ [Candidatus Bathyarchaeia archaeon]|nr:secondary thiamine-phosphate synthase enzyme YjbQ [Candidatus Bathyarchaeota archaeon]